MAFTARYDGTCYLCGGKITAGVDKITWSRNQRRGKRVRHWPACKTSEFEIPKGLTEEQEQQREEMPMEQEQERKRPLELLLEETGVTKKKEVPPGNGDAESALTYLAVALEKYLKTNGKDGLDEKQVKELVNKALAERLPAVVKVERQDLPDITIDNVHQSFHKLVYLLSKRHHAYLFGPPGSGKSTAARQASEALGLSFGYISLNPQTPDSRLLGFLDANGNYRKTVFRDLYENGGVFCIDELDNASPSLLTTLNTSFENGTAPFPDGMVERHKDFVVVGTGNTSGRGANPAFPERRPFDSAFAERFSYIAWGYDEKLERNIALAINPKATKYIDYVQALRKWAETNMPRLFVTPRASFKLAEYTKDDTLSLSEIVDVAIFKGIDVEMKNKAMRSVPMPEKG